MNNLHGSAGAAFQPLRQIVQEQLDDGSETGLSLVVDVAGERQVDLWGGHRDAARSLPWERDTVVNVWSITKTVTSLAALLLIDAGELDLHAPVSRYWPEFAANGKRDTEVRHILSHSSGVSGLEHPAVLEDLYDVRGAASRMAAQAPWWRAGSASGYHVLNYGHLVGELVHRLTGLSLKDFVAKKVAAPLGADFQIGLREADWARAAQVITPTVDLDLSAMDHRTVAYKTFTGPVFSADAANTPGWRAAELGAANGHGNARSVAQILGVVAGTSHNAPSLRAETVNSIFDEQTCGTDLVNGLQVRWGVGYALPDPRTLPWIPAGRVAFWGGWGGSMAIVDLDRQMTFSYVMNRMGADILGSERAARYVTAAYQALADLA